MQRSLAHHLQHHLALRVLCSGHIPGVPPAPPSPAVSIPRETYSHRTQGHPRRGLGITRVNSFPLAAPGRLREGPQHSTAQPSSSTGPGQGGSEQSCSGFDTQSQLTKFMALLRDIFRGFGCQQKALGWP